MLAIPGPDSRRRRQFAVALLQFGQQALGLGRVSVNDDERINRPGREPDVRVRPFRPPFADLGFVARGVLVTVLGQRLFAARFAGEDGVVCRCVGKRGFEQIWSGFGHGRAAVDLRRANPWAKASIALNRPPITSWKNRPSALPSRARISSSLSSASRRTSAGVNLTAHL